MTSNSAGTAAGLPAFVPQMVAIDLDGTIVDRSGVVSAAVIDRITAARRRGWTIVLATGRAPHDVQRVIRRYPELGGHWMITSNGVTVHEPAGRPARSLLTGIRPPLDDLRRNCADLTVTLEDPAGRYPGTAARPATDFPGPQVVTDWVRLRTLACLRIFAASESLSVSEAEPVFRTRDYLADIYRLPGGPTWIELQHPEATKAGALEFLRDRLGHSPDRTVAVGDSWNDVDMLRWAACGVAVADAVPEVLTVADARVGSCADDGVADLLDHLLDR